MDKKIDEIMLEFSDNEWAFEYIDHDRSTARAIVFAQDGFFYFVRAQRDDDFGKVNIIETAGGGVEKDEDTRDAVVREVREELGAEVEVLAKIGVISDYYNLIHRHNINNYYLCKVASFSERSLTEEEKNDFHLSVAKVTYEQALEEYEQSLSTPLGRLIGQREMPILKRAREIIDALGYDLK